ncbi:MAG: hypothetical protein ACRC5S_11445 [Cetobacterium sp.]
MHETTVSILKILYQTQITKENLAHNLNLKENTVAKSIIEINNFLKELGFNEIQVQDKNFRLNLTKVQWRKIFETLNSLTFEERVDYLYVKFIYFNSVNLEKEREQLNISRSSIDRCFLVVKNLLKKNGSKIITDKNKRNKLIEVSKYDKKLFLIKVTKLILEEDILIRTQKELLNNMRRFVLRIRIAKLISIYKCLKIPVTTILLSFLCALDIYTNRFNKTEKLFEAKVGEEKSNEMLKTITILVNNIGYSFSESYKKYLIYYINEIYLNRYYFVEDTLFKAKVILEELVNKFKIEDEKSKAIILEYLYLGILKRENNIFKVRNVNFYYEELIILDILNKILKDLKIELYICDKYSVVYFLKNKILEMNIKKIKKVLVYVQDVNLLRQIELKKELENSFQNIKFDIKYSFFKNKNKVNREYNYIIDDIEVNLERGDIFDRIKNRLQTLIIEKIILNKIIKNGSIE